MNYIMRYHCLEEMDIMRKSEKEWVYICKICNETEFATDPTKPTTKEEIPRKSMMDYGTYTKIGNK